MLLPETAAMAIPPWEYKKTREQGDWRIAGEDGEEQGKRIRRKKDSFLDSIPFFFQVTSLLSLLFWIEWFCLISWRKIFFFFAWSMIRSSPVPQVIFFFCFDCGPLAFAGWCFPFFFFLHELKAAHFRVLFCLMIFVNLEPRSWVSTVGES